MTRAAEDVPALLFKPDESRRLRALGLLLALAVGGGFLCFTLRYHVPADGGGDQNGYLVGGKMLARNGGSMRQAPADPFQYVGPMWVGVELGSAKERYYPKYPPGLPVLVAFLYKHHGPASAHLVSPVAMTLAVFGTFLLIRAVAGSLPGLLGMFALAVSPPTAILANTPSSHAAAACFVVLGMYLLVRWAQAGGPFRAMSAGMLLGLAAAVRYGEGLLVLPVVIAIVLTLRPRDRRRLLEAGLMLGWWGIVVLMLATYNLDQIGTLTGYDGTNESTAFSVGYFLSDGRHVGNWETLLRQFNDVGLPLLLPFAVVGLVCMVAWNGRLALLVGGWVLSTVALYSVYYFAPEGHPTAYLRFFFTAFPGLILLAVWPISRIRMPGRGGVVAGVAAAAVVGLSALISIRIALPHVEEEYRRDVRLHAAGRHVGDLPAGAVVIADDRTCNHLQFVSDVTLYDPAAFRESTYRLRTGSSGEPEVVQGARVRALAARLGGNVGQAELTRQLLRRVDEALAADRRVLIIAHLHPRRELIEAAGQQLPGSAVNDLAGRYDATVVARWNDRTDVAPERVPAVVPRPAKLLERPDRADPRHVPLGLIELKRRPATTRPTTRPAAISTP